MEEWLNTKLCLLAKGTLMLEKGYKGVFEADAKKQLKLIVKKVDFAKLTEIYL